MVSKRKLSFAKELAKRGNIESGISLVCYISYFENVPMLIDKVTTPHTPPSSSRTPPTTLLVHHSLNEFNLLEQFLGSTLEFLRGDNEKLHVNSSD